MTGVQTCALPIFFIALMTITLAFAFFNQNFFVAYLISIAVFGLFQAIYMANAGGAWDNAKKLVEVDLKEKGTPLHAATVIAPSVKIASGGRAASAAESGAIPKSSVTASAGAIGIWINWFRVSAVAAARVSRFREGSKIASSFPLVATISATLKAESASTRRRSGRLATICSRTLGGCRSGAEYSITASVRIDTRDRKSTRLNSSHRSLSRMPSSA